MLMYWGARAHMTVLASNCVYTLQSYVSIAAGNGGPRVR